MRVLFDQGVPVPLRNHLPGHMISTAFERGWATFFNGELLDAAEAAGFELLMTTDQNLKNQQNLGARPMAVVVPGSTSWPQIRRPVDAIRDAVAQIGPGNYIEVPI